VAVQINQFAGPAASPQVKTENRKPKTAVPLNARTVNAVASLRFASLLRSADVAVAVSLVALVDVGGVWSTSGRRHAEGELLGGRTVSR
jgi:hypothetical protein